MTTGNADPKGTCTTCGNVLTAEDKAEIAAREEVVACTDEDCTLAREDCAALGIETAADAAFVALRAINALLTLWPEQVDYLDGVWAAGGGPGGMPAEILCDAHAVLMRPEWDEEEEEEVPAS